MSVSVLIFVLGGVFSIVAAVLDWDWFMNNYRARLFVSLFGRTGARIFYVILGIGLIVFGLYYTPLR